jgi:choline dehydrogenase-like flavoprotein
MPADIAMRRFAGEKVDVCIVGSGAGGAPLAFELARAGASVVVLEKGPWYTTKDFTHDEIAINRRSFWSPPIADEPRLLKDSAAPAHKSGVGWTSNCVGGGTVHMSGFFYRLHPEDFRMRDRFPELDAEHENWPITYDELAPHYDRVESEVGVSGLAGEYPFEPPRRGPFPDPPLDSNPISALIDEGARSLGLHPFQTPRAIISRPRPDRAGCAYCDFCGSYGCEVNAKSSTAVALLPRAIATGRCEVRTPAMVFEVVVDASGRASGVRYFDAHGQIVEQKAALVCVSATAIESARLLLNSSSPAFPHGLANRNGHVGKHLHFSTLGKGHGEFERARLPANMQKDDGVHFLQRSLQDYYFVKDRPGYNKGGTHCFLLPPRGPIFASERIAGRDGTKWGVPLMQALHRYFHEVREIDFEVFGEYLPNAQSFVGVDPKVQDKWGLPVSSVQALHREEDVQLSRYLVERGLEVLTAAGATRTGIDTIGGTTYILQHGTCRFGDDPKTNVLNRWCQSHEVKNLFVVDGSFMPTSGGVATTMTIMANSFRVADYLKTRMKSGPL